jgi:hypothetical protein
VKRRRTIAYPALRVKDLPPPLRRHVLQQLAQPEPCLLCGSSRPAKVGVFVPEQPRRWGIPPGYHGAAFYNLCVRCLERPGHLAEVEALLWQARQRAVSARWN